VVELEVVPVEARVDPLEDGARRADEPDGGEHQLARRSGLGDQRLDVRRPRALDDRLERPPPAAGLDRVAARAHRGLEIGIDVGARAGDERGDHALEEPRIDRMERDDSLHGSLSCPTGELRSARRRGATSWRTMAGWSRWPARSVVAPSL